MLEPVVTNPFLELFYAEPKKYALKLQLWMYAVSLATKKKKAFEWLFTAPFLFFLLFFLSCFFLRSVFCFLAGLGTGNGSELWPRR
jgi:hypothetical protein